VGPLAKPGHPLVATRLNQPVDVTMSTLTLFCLSNEDPLFVIPGEDPGSILQHCPLRSSLGHSGSRIKSGMTDSKQARDDRFKANPKQPIDKLAPHLQTSQGRIDQAFYRDTP
jgi:hypothetical protein